MCDVLRNKEVSLADDPKRLNDLHDKEGIPRRREEMPDFDSLQGKRVAVLWNDEENDNSDIGNCVMMWYFGRVDRIMNKRGTGENKSCTAVIEWEAGGDVTNQPLKNSTWAGPSKALGLFSWMQAAEKQNAAQCNNN